MKKNLIILLMLITTANYGQTQCVTCANSTADGDNASVIGIENQANAINSKIIGMNSITDGWHSIAIGNFNTTYQTAGNSFAFGMFANVVAGQCMVIGIGADNTHRLSNNIQQSLMIGFNSDKPTFFVSRSSGYNKTGQVVIGNRLALQNGPEAKLHIRSDEGEEAAVFIEPNRWQTGAWAGLWLGNKQYGLKAVEGAGLTFLTGKNYYFPDGKVSIGRSTSGDPAAELDVNGTVQMTGLRLTGQIIHEGFVLTSINQNGQAQWRDPLTVIPQTWIKTADNDIYYNEGRVSINTDVTPTARDMYLTVKGSQIIYGPNAGLFFGDDGNTVSGYGKYGVEHQNGGLNFWIPWQGDEGKTGRFMNYVLFLKDNGNVGIGTEDPKEKLDVNGTVLFHQNDNQYLSIKNRQVVFGSENYDVNTYVNGKIWANEIEVSTDRWSDNVFEDDYLLKPIKEVETFIKENKHLPGVPAEKEVVENGINVAEMDAVLLKKIEELTLYVIEQENNISILKNEIKLLKKKIK